MGNTGNMGNTIFLSMFLIVPGNILKHSGTKFWEMTKNSPETFVKRTRECLQIFGTIPDKCLQTLHGMSTKIQGNIHYNSGKYVNTV